MQESNFLFLEKEFPILYNTAQSAEFNLHQDPVTTLFKLRQFGEKLSELLFGEHHLEFPKENTFHTRLKTLQQEGLLPFQIKDLLFLIKSKGNLAVHLSKGTKDDAKTCLNSAHKIALWFFETYASDLNLEYSQVYREPENLDARHALAELEKQHKKLEANLQELLKERSLKAQAPEEKAAIRQKSNKAASKLEMNEAETRMLIDEQLRQAGWEVDSDKINYKTHRTKPQKGQNVAIAEWPCGRMWADYALFIDKKLIGIIEAKKHIKNVSSDLNQAKNYSQAANASNDAELIKHENSASYKVPFMFATNGKPYLEQLKTASGIWFWDGRKQSNLDRPIREWFTPRDLEEKLEFDELTGEKNLKKTDYELLKDPLGLSLRDYQIEAIKAVEHKILDPKAERRALLAMATGTGKTRTILGMCYRLIKAKRFKRILFLVDRRMLGTQAADDFKEVKMEGLQTFAQIYDIAELEQKAADLDTKIQFATVQSMVSRIMAEDAPSTGTFDCIVVDEAHRGYTLDREMEEEELVLRNQEDFQSKYRMVLDHFDAYRIGLTATPAVHTAEIFGDPVYTYSYRKAVVDGYLIDFDPPYVFQTQLTENGIVWNKGDEVKVYDPEESDIKSAGITEDEIKVDVAGFNRKVLTENFNKVILRELIESYGLDPDDKKKTLIFAVSKNHADEIVRLLKEQFNDLGQQVDNDAIVTLVGDTHKREELLRRYKNEQYPSIVVTVDLLTTGIDVPPICKIVFLRRVNSRILYDQMLGRATRRCDDVGKKTFQIYDCVGVTELMGKEQVMKPVAPLLKKTFANLVEEIALIEDESLKELKLDRIIAKLQAKVRSLNNEQIENLSTLAKVPSVKELTQKLQNTPQQDLDKVLEGYHQLWAFLDKEKGKRTGFYPLFSEHADELTDVTRAYHKNLKPKDYIESFEEYIKAKVNEVAALKLLCTKPASLTRKNLKELRLLLDQDGYTKTQLNAAYAQMTNKEIVADIIGLVRTAALGTTLLSHEERIKGAVTQLKAAHPEFNAIQNKWISRIESQLLQESIITLEDLDKPPFKNDGGLRMINKAFKNQTDKVVEELNEYLYREAN
jgi:type I restriction enzyme R subunit